VIRFGVAGWDYKDWWGPVYPTPRPRGFDPLAYLSRYFDVVEINSTFYGAGSPKASRDWVQRVRNNPRFQFTAKLWKRFTHEREQAWTPAEVELVRASLEPVAVADRLGALLAQFPWSFRRSPENEEWLGDLLQAFREYPLAVEVRHASWSVPEFYASLGERMVGVVNIDQPLFDHSIAPGARVTGGRVGYVRLHGRNYGNWFREEAESHERYDYLYTPEELQSWLDRIHQVAEHARSTFVITNNHFLGQAPANAAMLRKLYGESEVTVPPELAEAYRSILEPLGIKGRATATRDPDLGL
jgi:uncharacterized protein YecE (DUF72 family)